MKGQKEIEQQLKIAEDYFEQSKGSDDVVDQYSASIHSATIRTLKWVLGLVELKQ